jgi:hypothetical protein
MKMAEGMHFSVVCAEDLPRLPGSSDRPGADFGDMAIMSINEGLDFVEEFGLDGFLDIVDQAIDNQIPIDWFNKVMTDHKVARECFPYLGRYESIE